MLDAVLRLLTIISLVPMVQAAGNPSQQNVGHIFDPIEPAAVHGPRRVETDRVGVMISSPSVFAADVASSKVLYAVRPHDVRPIASLTKLMTAMVVMDYAAGNLDAPIRFLEDDLADDWKGIFGSGESVTTHDALRALLVGSVNAAGDALARETLGREEFIRTMNAKAASLGLASPVFVDPTGISLENRASAADVAAMLTIALSYPEIREIVSLDGVDIRGGSGKAYHVDSTNLLLDSYLNKAPYSIIGAKTGSLPDGGYSMAMVTRSGDGHEVVVVAIGSENHFSRYHDIKLVTSWVFDVFTWDDDAGRN